MMHSGMVNALTYEQAPGKPGYLFVLPWSLAQVGGVNQVVRQLFARAAKGSQVRPLLLVTPWERPNEGDFVSGVRQMHLRLRNPWGETRRLKTIAGCMMALPNSLWKLGRLLRAERIRVVNVHFPDLGFLHFALLRRLGLFDGSFVISLHGADINEIVRSKGVERYLWRFLLRSADAITTCSRWLAAVAAEFDPSLAPKLRAVHNGTAGIDRNDGVGSGGSAVATRSERILLNIGKFEFKKGQDVLLRAFKQMLQDRKDLKLVLVGGAGPALDNVKEMITAEGLEDKVQLHVNVPHEQIGRFLAEACVFVLSSRIEPFGIVVLEAGLAGVPVVASTVGGVPEIVADGVNGRLVPPDDPEALARALGHALDNPAESARMAEQLRRDVMARFSWEQCYQGYLDAAGVAETVR